MADNEETPAQKAKFTKAEYVHGKGSAGYTGPKRTAPASHGASGGGGGHSASGSQVSGSSGGHAGKKAETHSPNGSEKLARSNEKLAKTIEKSGRTAPNGPSQEAYDARVAERDNAVGNLAKTTKRVSDLEGKLAKPQPVPQSQTQPVTPQSQPVPQTNRPRPVPQPSPSAQPKPTTSPVADTQPGSATGRPQPSFTPSPGAQMPSWATPEANERAQQGLVTPEDAAAMRKVAETPTVPDNGSVGRDFEPDSGQLPLGLNRGNARPDVLEGIQTPVAESRRRVSATPVRANLGGQFQPVLEGWDESMSGPSESGTGWPAVRGADPEDDDEGYPGASYSPLPTQKGEVPGYLPYPEPESEGTGWPTPRPGGFGQWQSQRASAIPAAGSNLQAGQFGNLNQAQLGD